MPKLTKKVVEQLRAAGCSKERHLWDSELKGFGVRLYPSGRAMFVLKYRTRLGEARKLNLGVFGPLTAERARELATIELARVVEGEDPSAKRRQGREALSVAQLCDRYMQHARDGLVVGRRGKPKKASTLYVDGGRIERHIKPLLGHRKANSVSRADIEVFRDDVARGRTAADVKTKRFGRAIVEGGKGTATRTLGLLGGIFAWGEARGLVASNPVRGVRRFADGQRKAFLTPAQYRLLGRTLDGLSARRDRHGQPRHNLWGLACLRFLALTGFRSGEALTLRWTDIDFQRRVAVLGDTKTGESVRPLGQPVIALLSGLEHVSEFVFAAEPGATKSYQGLDGLWTTAQRTAGRIAAADERDGGQRASLAGFSAHSFRHSFASTAEEFGMTFPTIKAMLGQRLHGVTGGYIKKLDQSILASADRVSGRIDRLMRGYQPSDTVVTPIAPHASAA